MQKSCRCNLPLRRPPSLIRPGPQLRWGKQSCEQAYDPTRDTGLFFFGWARPAASARATESCSAGWMATRWIRRFVRAPVSSESNGVTPCRGLSRWWDTSATVAAGGERVHRRPGPDSDSDQTGPGEQAGPDSDGAATAVQRGGRAVQHLPVDQRPLPGPGPPSIMMSISSPPSESPGPRVGSGAYCSPRPAARRGACVVGLGDPSLYSWVGLGDLCSWVWLGLARPARGRAEGRRAGGAAAACHRAG